MMSQPQPQPLCHAGLLLSLGLVGCGYDDFTACADIDTGRLPQMLSETGLFTDVANDMLSPGVRAFEPQFKLWSDGAEKRRWIFLPAGTRIDTSDPDFWQFPEGTRLWKEFTRDGIRVETRMLAKLGPNPQDWVPLAYVWNDALTDAFATPSGLDNARGTAHQVPSASSCMGCHGGTPSHVLGFSAVQLSWDAPSGLTDLKDLMDGGLLSAAPAPPVVPGNELERQALGYLHANCSHCHNQSRPATTGPRCYDPERDFEFLLRVSDLGSVAQTATYRTGISEDEFKPGDANGSKLIQQMTEGSMPALGKKTVDAEHLDLLRRWIAAQ